MQRTSTLIKAHEDDFPYCAYYLPLLSKARRNARKHPDICIETCKSVLEGISKTIILNLDPSATKADLEKKDVDQNVKAAAKLLKENDDIVEDNFVTRATSLANALGALRNARGDISHGKAAPKTTYSQEKFARLCLQMTDAIAVYLLESFYRSKARAQPPSSTTVGGGTTVDSVYIPSISYEQHAEFNDQLDDANPLPGKVLYSEALYRLYYEDYVIELGAYLDAIDEAEASSENQEQ